jgi:hypothetical protein
VTDISRKTLDALRTQIEEGYASHGTLHRLLQEWHRVDDAGIPGGGRLFESVPIALGSFDDALLQDVIHLDQIGLGFAQEEAELYFVDPERTTSATPGPRLDAAVGKAVAKALAYGFDAAIWVNVADEWLADTSGATVDPQPEPTRDGCWHHRRVIKTTLTPAGEIWVAGQDAGTLRYYGEHDGSESGIRIAVQERGGTRVFRASLRLDVVKRTPAALQRITIEQ